MPLNSGIKSENNRKENKMDSSKLPPMSKKSTPFDSVWKAVNRNFDTSGGTIKKKKNPRVVNTEKDPGRRAGGYTTSKETKKNILDKADPNYKGK